MLLHVLTLEEYRSCGRGPRRACRLVSTVFYPHIWDKTPRRAGAGKEGDLKGREAYQGWRKLPWQPYQHPVWETFLLIATRWRGIQTNHSLN
jgi:hypothetical protein